VLDLAVVDDGHGFEAAVRVAAHAAPLRGGLELGRRRVVEHQKRAALGHALAAVAEQPVHRKAVAHPVAAGGAADVENALGGGWRGGGHGESRFRFRWGAGGAVGA